MTERQVTKEVCQALRTSLERNAHRAANSPIFEKQLVCGTESYTLFLMLAKDRVYTLYALRRFRQNDGAIGYQTVSNPNVLAGLTHILILQSTTGCASSPPRAGTDCADDGSTSAPCSPAPFSSGFDTL